MQIQQPPQLEEDTSSLVIPGHGSAWQFLHDTVTTHGGHVLKKKTKFQVMQDELSILRLGDKDNQSSFLLIKPANSDCMCFYNLRVHTILREVGEKSTHLHLLPCDY